MVVALATFAAPSVRADGLQIVSHGLSTYQIVCSQDAVPATLLAATELQQFIEQSTGVRLPIVAPVKRGLSSIVLRYTPALPRDSFRLEASGPDIIITGHDTKGNPGVINFENPVSCGTLYGVYEFLERFLGIRFYWPDTLGTIVPKHAELSVPTGLHVQQAPRFALRRLQYGPGFVNHRDEDATRMWGRRLRLGASMPTRFNHNWWRIVDVEQWARRGHAEYAALVNGVRSTVYEKVPAHRNGQVCTSNAEVQDIFVAAARASKRGIFPVSPNDGYGGFCQCEKCQSLDSGRVIPDGRFAGRRDLSDRIVKFYNLIGERSGRPVAGYAYNEYVGVPAHTKLHPNVSISLAINNAFLSGRPDERARAERLYRAWGAYSPTTTAYDIFYLTRQMPNLLAPLGTDIERRIRLVEESGLAGAHFYIAPKMELGGPDAYVAAKMLWDPRIDTVRIREAYLQDLYGSAWRSIQRLYERAAQQWRHVVAQHKNARKRRQAFLKILPTLRADLEHAERECDDDPAVKERLFRLREAVGRMASE